MAAISTLLLLVALSLVVTRVATAILVATGMDGRAARFQARSALTGAGFTTTESEQITAHPLRRRVVMTLMLLGNAGLVGAASTLILGFRGGAVGADGYRVLELVLGLIALVYLSRSPRVDRRLTALIARVLHDHTDLAERDLGGLLKLSGSYEVSELAVDAGEWVADRTLAELDLRDEGVVVLGVDRTAGGYTGAPVGATRIRPGDTLVLYGRGDDLHELDSRRAGPEGDRRHEEAVARQLRRVAAEQAAEPEG